SLLGSLPPAFHSARIALTESPRLWQARVVIGSGRASLVVAVWAFGLLLPSCGTVELGENLVQPNTQLSEDYFYCFIQPDVISPAGCATGLAGDTGGCHRAQSSLRLVDTTGVSRPSCTGVWDDGANVRLTPGAVVPPE